MRRIGLWVANGTPSNADQMLSWRPGSLTCFYDYLQPNRVIQYKQDNPTTDVIIRFQHPKNWRENPTISAKNYAAEIVSKWPVLRDIDPYVYFGNEMNLHYENGDENIGNQYMYETPEFYALHASWVKMVAENIKNVIPDMRLVFPPFAFGHHEDGAPDDSGNPKDGWAGYDYYEEFIPTLFDNIMTFHAYWGNATGSNRDWLYDPELSSWYAFRWQRVEKLFKVRYGQDIKHIIDEAGNFSVSDRDFTEQVMYFGKKCLACSSVIALTMFLWEDPTYSAGNMMNSWVAGCYNLSEHVQQLKEMPDITITSEPNVSVNRGVKIQLEDGSVELLNFEDYLRGVIPAEMPVRAVEYGGYADAALEAQVVAARSYTMYRLEHPRDAQYDLKYTDQAFNKAAIGSVRADAAIAATNGIYLLKDGEVFEAEYIKRCGRDECPYCLGTAFYISTTHAPDGKWVNRFCQDGANELAKEGYTYREILDFYYGHLDLTYSTDPAEVLEPETIKPIIQPEEGNMFDFKTIGEEILPRYNDAERFGVAIIPEPTTYTPVYTASVHALTGSENNMNHHLYFMVLDKDNNQVPNAKIDWEWTWNDMTEEERPHPNPIICDKEEWEGPPGNLPLIKEWPQVNVWMHDAVSDRAEGMQIRWAKEEWEEPGVEWGHRSFYIVFKETTDPTTPIPDPIPDPDPEPPVNDEVEAILRQAVEISNELSALLTELDKSVIQPLENLT